MRQFDSGSKCFEKIKKYFMLHVRIGEFLEQFRIFLNDQRTVRLCGRLQGIRNLGPKLTFADLISDGHKVQVMTNGGTLSRGDIVQLEGVAYLGKNENTPTIKTSNIKVLRDCERRDQFPSVKTGLSDPHLRVEKRHLDLAVNNSINLFKMRAQIIRHLRDTLHENGFTEVETPILSYEAGGALAEPFITCPHDGNGYNKNPFYLRIAPELFLKKCIIGGMERIFEFGKVFRNEGVDSTHQPEFTSLEFYWAYTSLEEVMNFVQEKLLKNQFPKIERKDVVEELEKHLGEPLILSNRSFFVEKLKKIGFSSESKGLSMSKMFDTLVDYYVKPETVFLMNHPKFGSPLASTHPIKSDQTERFELFLNGIELANGYVELNDPEEQLERFRKQAIDNGKKDPDKGDLEYVEALRFGLPPTVGCGIGVDRLVMLLSAQKSIRDVILFPHH